MSAQGDIEICSNCDDKIGRLETPQIWNGRVVCRRCYDKLSTPAAVQNPATRPQHLGDKAGASEEGLRPGMIRCKGCNNPISVRADLCPHCGRDRIPIGCGGMVLFLAIGIVFVLIKTLAR
jgi:predicted amidophosphoribosyltransferase